MKHTAAKKPYVIRPTAMKPTVSLGVRVQLDAARHPPSPSRPLQPPPPSPASSPPDDDDGPTDLSMRQLSPLEALAAIPLPRQEVTTTTPTVKDRRKSRPRPLLNIKPVPTLAKAPAQSPAQASAPASAPAATKTTVTIGDTVITLASATLAPAPATAATPALATAVLQAAPPPVGVKPVEAGRRRPSTLDLDEDGRGPPTKRLAQLAAAHLRTFRLHSEPEERIFKSVVEFVSTTLCRELGEAAMAVTAPVPMTSTPKRQLSFSELSSASPFPGPAAKRRALLDSSTASSSAGDVAAATAAESGAHPAYTTSDMNTFLAGEVSLLESLDKARHYMIKTFECVCCFNVPRPRHNRPPFKLCPNEHVICNPCWKRLDLPHRCPACIPAVPVTLQDNVSQALFRMYVETTTYCSFQCQRNCGRWIAGYNPILDHDRVCCQGKRVICPIDKLQVALYAHSFNKHTRHLLANFPIEYTPRTWSFTLYWDTVTDHLEHNSDIPVQVLYMENEANFKRRDRDLELDPYLPNAAFVIFRVVGQNFEYDNVTRSAVNITTLEMTVRWAESQPYITEVLPYYFAVKETKWNRNVATRCTSSLLPTYQDPPPLSNDPFPADMRMAREARAFLMPSDDEDVPSRPPRTPAPPPVAPRPLPAATAAAADDDAAAAAKRPRSPDEPSPPERERPKTPRPFSVVCQRAADAGKLHYLQGDGLPKTFAHILDNRHLRGLVGLPTYTCSKCGIYSRMHTHLEFSLVGDLNA